MTKTDVLALKLIIYHIPHEYRNNFDPALTKQEIDKCFPLWILGNYL